MDADGLVADRLPGRVDAVYTTPSHQAPTGVVLANARRGAIGRLLELGFGLADEPALDDGLAELTAVLARLRRRRPR
ncbi:MAG: hypothetical protein QM733_00820 [Ilumatobacteraceae bacterium]